MAEGVPTVYAIPPGVPVAEALAAGLRARAEAPEWLARATLLLDTRRAGRAVEAALEAAAPASFLPRILGLAEAGEDPTRALPPAVEPLRRWLHLTRLVAAWLARFPERGPAGAAPALARALAALLDEVQREGVGLAALGAGVPPEHAAHWEATQRLLVIVAEAWPGVLAEAEGGALDPAARRRAGIAAMLAGWREADPGPVFAAGSPGAAATSAEIMAAVARLPQGAAILPGFDPALAAEVWEGIGPEHPYAGFRALLETLGLGAGDVAPWSPEAGPAARRRLIGQALRPAPVTDGWLAARPALAADMDAATAGMALIAAPDPRREASAIALALREAVEAPGTRAALVTPDRDLARRVAAELRRVGIEADDSGGRPLALTPPGVFLRLVAEAAFAPFDPVTLLALLKHPLAAAGSGRGGHLAALRRLEIGVLRGHPEIDSLSAARAALRRLPLLGAALDAGEMPADGAEDEPVPDPDPVDTALGALIALQTAGPDLAAMADAHRATAEAIAGPALWTLAAGERAAAVTARFAAAASVHGPAAPGAYPALFAGALAGEAVAEAAFRPDPRVAIWGTLEARMQGADLIVLGGLVEGVWPAPPPPDPWLSRPMRRAAGLPEPEVLIGLEALGVLQAACAPRVVLSRALKAGGAPTTPSRWLARLTTLIRGVDAAALEAMQARGDRLLGLVERLDRPVAAMPAAARPRPAPPVTARPRRLSATAIETLIRDPYAIYARSVLGLRRLPVLGIDSDARLRGEVLHAALHAFALRADPWPADPQAVLRESLEDAMAAAPLTAVQRALWRTRLDRLAARFLPAEALRRADLAASLGEVAGRRTGPGFELVARADRIDRLADGRLAIYDYKTGAIPSARQIALFAKQLPLEAAIAEAGGFEGVPAAPVAALGHISLGGGKEAGATHLTAEAPAALAEAAWQGLERLMARYADPETGYPARARPQQIGYASDYDHLSRLGEWEDGGDD